jgi:dTDP-4-dehydrorhamnose 3,5-epimerase
MKFELLEIPDLILIHPRVYEDERGYFFESFNKNNFTEAGITEEFVQDNQSLSQPGVLRGLHFQTGAFAQSKLVRVIKGAVLDVAVDIRKGSPTYGKHFSVELNETNKLMLYIPIGFAHGFLTLAEDTIFSYKCGNVYNKASENGIMWDDPDLNIYWNILNPILSDKDKTNENFTSFKSPFDFIPKLK